MMKKKRKGIEGLWLPQPTIVKKKKNKEKIKGKSKHIMLFKTLLLWIMR